MALVLLAWGRGVGGGNYPAHWRKSVIQLSFLFEAMSEI